MEAKGYQEWWVRRVVLALLLVVAAVTTVYAVFATRSDSVQAATDQAPDEVVATFEPKDQPSDGPLRLDQVLVVGRHGAPVDVPEHTAESYAAAIEAGVDHVETEVVMTEDGELVVRSDNELSGSTDVAERDEFADRETTKVIDEVETTGWFTEDFTLDELRTLKATEPDPDLRLASAAQDGAYSVISFDDLLIQVGEYNAENDSETGIFVQPRHTSYFRSLGKAMEPAVAKSLRRARLINEPGRVTVESSDLAFLKRIEGNLGDNVLSGYVVDADSADLLEADAIAELPDTIDAILVEAIALNPDTARQTVEDLHAAGLAVALYPISYENDKLGESFKEGDEPSGVGDLNGLMEALVEIDIDIVLADSPAEVVEVVAEIEADGPTPSSTPS